MGERRSVKHLDLVGWIFPGDILYDWMEYLNTFMHSCFHEHSGKGDHVFSSNQLCDHSVVVYKRLAQMFEVDTPHMHFTDYLWALFTLY